jgi:arylsulfatase A-like enzyme
MKPNVLVLVVDSLRADRVLDGERSCRTPNLDAFRESATAFTHVCSVVTMTTPSVASILTGTYPFVHGVHSLSGRPLGPDLLTLGELFKANGYHTWAEVTGPLEAFTGLDRGFDDYRYRAYTEWLDTPFGNELASRIARSRMPWFGFAHLWEVHYPRRIARQYNRPRYGELAYDRAVSSLDEQLGRLLAVVPGDTVVVLTSDHGEYLPHSRRDELVTRLKGPAAWLKRNVPGAKRLRRRVMPLLFKDLAAGAPAGAERYRAWLGHGFHVYEPLVRVPLVLRAPGLFRAGVKISSIASHVDLLPTLASALELDGGTPSHLSGFDLTTLLRDGGSLPREAVYLQASGARRMSRPEQWLAGLRTERYKYARGMHNDALPEELYDLESDPDERRNLATGRPDVAAELKTRLSALIENQTPEETPPETAYTPEEEELLEARLRELGYLD